jgi:hypothetical protein
MRNPYLAVATAAVISVAVCGCQASQSVDRTPISAVAVSNTRSIQEPFEAVWDRMVRNLASEFFVINNVEKTSRIMNVSFSADDPSEYVDCGRSTRKFKPAMGSERSFSYGNADKEVSYMGATPEGFGFLVQSRRNLEGRANIYVAPNSAGGTDISVNIRYIINLNATGYGLDQYGNIASAPQAHPGQTWSFDTTKPSVVDRQQGEIKCASKGILEQKILDASNL